MVIALGLKCTMDRSQTCGVGQINPAGQPLGPSSATYLAPVLRGMNGWSEKLETWHVETWYPAWDEGWSEKLENWHVETWYPVWKKARKQQFSPGSRSLWIWHLKIYKYFINICITWISKDIWIRFSRAMFNWSPQFYSHPFCSLCELQLILWQILLLQKIVFNSHSYMNWKWNCKAENIQIFQIFLSEIILAEENGSQGHSFGKILNSKFVKGLRHSAMQCP